MPSVRSPRAGVVACLAGLALAAAVQVAAPLPGPPLYDGVVSVEPYVYLQPSGTQQGGALGASSSNAVVGGVSPAIVLGTPEQPPQAQLLAAAGSLALPGTTRLVVSITPVPATVEPASGTIVGNVYRVLIVNQAGAPVTGLPDRQVTLALRDPGSTGLASIEHLTGGTWQSLPTVSAAVTGTYETTGVTTFGDFALVGTPSAGGGAGGASPFAIITVGALVLALAAAVSPSVRNRLRRNRPAR